MSNAAIKRAFELYQSHASCLESIQRSFHDVEPRVKSAESQLITVMRTDGVGFINIDGHDVTLFLGADHKFHIVMVVNDGRGASVATREEAYRRASEGNE